MSDKITWRGVIEVVVPPELNEMARFIREYAIQIEEDAKLGNGDARWLLDLLGKAFTRPEAGILRQIYQAVEQYQAGMVCPICGAVGYRHLCD